ncbi:MAG: S1 RNA-binding domain-containing protein [Clostridia bacterium]|nr:S1 RNA-binding domain-containing protein [Clostridia bacterium]
MITQKYLPEGHLSRCKENSDALSTPAAVERAAKEGRILEAGAVVCDSDMSVTVDLGCMRGILPKEEVVLCGQGETVKDIAVITRVGKPVCFKVTGFGRDVYGSQVAYLSRRAAQEECVRAYLSALRPGDVIDARVTHLEHFGAFVDIGCGIVSLLSIDCISVSRITHPRDRLRVGDDLKCVVKSIDRDTGRIYVTHKELLGTWEDNAARFSIGQTVAGVVRSVEDYGIFVELTPNLAGLAEYKEGVSVGQSAAVYIKNMVRERMKIKLVLIDTSPASPPAEPFSYYLPESGRVERWRYSPDTCEKMIETYFDAS